MIVDSSALVAILKNESDAESLSSAIEAASSRRMSAANFLEAAIVIDSHRSPVASRRLDEVLSESQIEIVPVTESQARIARAAYRDYGRGSGHPAGLNFGDCFAYALASECGEPLLFKGDDFVHTDVKAAI